MSSSTILGLIPARGGSKGIPRKNVTDLAGRPLIEYTVEAARESSVIDRTVVTTDDDEIASVAEAAGAEVPFMRPDSLAADDTATEPVVTHALEELSTDFSEFVLLQPTSPLRTAEHVDEAVKKYRTADATSLVTVYEDHSYRWQADDEGATQINHDGERKRRQDKQSEYVENGAIYMTDVPSYLETESFTTGRTVLYTMNRLDSIDVDEPVDLRMAAVLLEQRS